MALGDSSRDDIGLRCGAHVFLEFAVDSFECVASKTEQGCRMSAYCMLLSGMLLTRARLENEATNTFADTFQKSLDSVFLGTVQRLCHQP